MATPATPAPAPLVTTHAGTHPKVLCVDDEPQILAGLAVNLRRRYQVITAGSGQAALDVLAQNPDTAVVVSDMRMPGMDGAAFLARAKHAAPDAVRILLTGQADLDSAMQAVNQGEIFRFLTKPCPTMTLLSSIYHAVLQHNLLTAERVLLEQTLRGVVRTLTDVLSITNPVSFGRASRIKGKVLQMAKALEMEDCWQVEVAAMLSHLGAIALGPETAARVYQAQDLSPDDAKAVARVPVLTDRLLANIPRLEVVRGMLAGISEPYRRVDPDEDDGQAAVIVRGAQMLKVAIDFDALQTQHKSSAKALDIMVARGGDYDPEILVLVPMLLGPESTHDYRSVSLSEIAVGMIFAEDIHIEESGTLLVAHGLEVTTGMMERLHNVKKGTVKEPVHVLVPR